MNVFELCRELDKLGFPRSNRNDSWYFVTPEVLIMQRDLDDLKLIDGRTTIDFDKLIYYPSSADLMMFLGENLQQIIRTNRSGWFAYADSTHGNGITTRSGGDTPWLALANVIYARFLERNQQMPIFDVSESENIVQGEEPPHEDN